MEFGCWIALAICLSLSFSGAESKKPNILYISSDQQRLDTLACYGSKFASSPNIDRIAKEGVRFKDAYTVSPVCSPSRTSLLTGVHVPIHGIYENGVKPYRDHLTPYTDYLKKAGYYTAIIGKAHFSPIPNSFDHKDIHGGNDDKRGNNVSINDFLETYLVNATMNLIKKTAKSPWYIHLSMISPHPPNYIPVGWNRIYDSTTFPPINYVEGDIGRLPYQTRMLLNLLGKEDNDPPAFPNGKPNMTYIDEQRHNYYEQAAYVDFEVGRMLDFLDQEKLANDTLVIYTTDHGTELFDHGINNDKHNFLDGSWHVPLLLRYPGVLPAGKETGFAINIDLTATFLAAAGLNASTYQPYQGFDLLTPLSQGKESPRQVGVGVEYRAFAVATPKWKLAFYPEQNEGRLFNRVDDPQEQTDLFGNEKHATVRDGLLRAILRWRSLQDPLEYLQDCSHSGAQTATEAWNHTEHLTGLMAETGLQEDALQWE